MIYFVFFYLIFSNFILSKNAKAKSYKFYYYKISGLSLYFPNNKLSL